MSNGTTAPSVLAADVQVTGTIRCSGPIRIDGKLEGDLVCAADAIIGRTATIKGNLSVNMVSIEGTINGNIAAKDKIEMKSTAKVLGDISAKRLSVEDGVTFIGKSEVNPSGAVQPSGLPAPEAPRMDAGNPIRR